MKTRIKINGGCFAAQTLISIFCVITWIINLIQFCKCDFEQPLKKEVVKGIGVFIPPASAITVFCMNGQK